MGCAALISEFTFMMRYGSRVTVILYYLQIYNHCHAQVRSVKPGQKPVNKWLMMTSLVWQIVCFGVPRRFLLIPRVHFLPSTNVPVSFDARAHKKRREHRTGKSPCILEWCFASSFFVRLIYFCAWNLGWYPIYPRGCWDLLFFLASLLSLILFCMKVFTGDRVAVIVNWKPSWRRGWFMHLP